MKTGQSTLSPQCMARSTQDSPTIILDQPGDGGAWFVYHNCTFFDRHSPPYIRVDRYVGIKTGNEYSLSDVRVDGTTIRWTVDGLSLNGKPAHFTVACFVSSKEAMNAYIRHFTMRRRRNSSFGQ